MNIAINAVRRPGPRSLRGAVVAVVASMLALIAGATPSLGTDSGTVDAQVTVS